MQGFSGGMAGGYPPPAGLVIGFDPSLCDHPGGVVHRAQNRVGSDLTPLGTAPLWSATGLNGRPALVFDGITERRLQVAIPPSFAGLAPDVVVIAAVSFNDSPSLSQTLIVAYTAPNNSAVPGTDPSAGLIHEFFVPGTDSSVVGLSDDAGSEVISEADGISASAAVWTAISSHASHNIVARRNGVTQGAPSSTAGLIAMSAQRLIVIGGTTDGGDVAFGATLSAGAIGAIMVFGRSLSAGELDKYERQVGALSGLTW